MNASVTRHLAGKVVWLGHTTAKLGKLCKDICPRENMFPGSVTPTSDPAQKMNERIFQNEPRGVANPPILGRGHLVATSSANTHSLTLSTHRTCK